MDKREGLERKSNDGKRAKKTHRLGAYKKILRKVMKRKKNFKLPSLKSKSNIKEGECQSRLGRAK
jgi:hypothetical protein